MYQNIYLHSVTSDAANRGAFYYVNQFISEDYSASTTDLYWRIFDSNSENKKSSIETFTQKGLKPAIINTSNEVKVNTSFNFLICQLEISIVQKYPLPVGGLLTVFGISPTINIAASKSVPLEDNAEFVRNLDMVMDIKNCLINSDNKWIGNSTKVSETIDKLVKKR